ncbi:MAG: Sec-independent protein translocase subunit TatA/TatB [Thermoleophilaceae bacterium]
MPLGVGLPEIIIVLVIALVIFGPKRLPELGKSLGSGMKSFKESVTNDDDGDKKLSKAEAKPEPVHAEKSEKTPAPGGQSS